MLMNILGAIAIAIIILALLNPALRKPRMTDDEILTNRRSQALSKTNTHYQKLPKDFAEWQNWN